jgi:hypothetical protein
MDLEDYDFTYIICPDMTNGEDDEDEIASPINPVLENEWGNQPKPANVQEIFDFVDQHSAQKDENKRIKRHQSILTFILVLFFLLNIYAPLLFTPPSIDDPPTRSVQHAKTLDSPSCPIVVASPKEEEEIPQLEPQDPIHATCMRFQDIPSAIAAFIKTLTRGLVFPFIKLNLRLGLEDRSWISPALSRL